MRAGVRADLAISVVLAAAFVFLAAEAGAWDYRSALFPQAIGVAGLAAVGALLVVLAISRRLPDRTPGSGVADQPPESGSAPPPAGNRDHVRAFRLLAWIGAVIGLSWLLGQMVAMPLFMLGFLRFEAGFRWLTASFAALLTGGFLYVVFDRVLTVTWLDGAGYRWAAGAL